MKGYSPFLFITGLYCLFGLTAPDGMAQEQAGIVADNYTPIKQHLLNPSAIVDQKVWLDLNVAGAAAFGRTNFIYLPGSTLSKPSEINQAVYASPRKFLKAHAYAEILGPSLSLSFGQHAIAFHTRVRVLANANRIPSLDEELLDEPTEEDLNRILSLKNARVKSMAWAELGLTYGKILKQQDHYMLTGAITVNYMIGVGGMAAIVNEANVDLSDTTGMPVDGNGRYAYAAPAWKAGNGWGVDLGVTYKHMLDDVTAYVPHSTSSGCILPDYKYKVGISLRDVGAVKFTKDALYAEIDENLATSDFENVTDPDDVNDAILNTDGTKFTAALPTAISGQFDYNLGKGFYLNSIVTHRISNPGGFGVERANVFAVSGRFERKFLGAAIPVSLYEYTTPQLGMMIRIGPLILGSDNFLPFLVQTDIYGGDIYAYVNFSINKSPQKDKPRVHRLSVKKSVIWTTPSMAVPTSYLVLEPRLSGK